MLKKSMKNYSQLQEENIKTRQINKKILVILLIITIITMMYTINLINSNIKQPYNETTEIKTYQLPKLQNQETSIDALYDYYKQLERPNTREYNLYIINPYDDLFFKEYFKTYSSGEMIEYVQDLEYVNEPKGVEYPKYPIETMLEGGDCEDKSILLAQIFYSYGDIVELIEFPTHMMVRWRDCYIETTANKCDCNIPIGFKGKEYRAIEIDPAEPIPTYHWEAFFYKQGDYFWVDTEINVSNYGLVDSEKLTLLVNISNKQQILDIGNIPAFTGKKIWITQSIEQKSIDIELMGYEYT